MGVGTWGGKKNNVRENGGEKYGKASDRWDCNLSGNCKRVFLLEPYVEG